MSLSSMIIEITLVDMKWTLITISLSIDNTYLILVYYTTARET